MGFRLSGSALGLCRIGQRTVRWILANTIYWEGSGISGSGSDCNLFPKTCCVPGFFMFVLAHVGVA